MVILCRKTSPVRKYSPNGFTLLELLVVMVLATLVMALVPASFSSMFPHAERESEVRQFVSALRSARGIAIRDKEDVSLKLDLENHRYYLPGDEQIRQLPDNFHFLYIPSFNRPADKAAVIIRFYADGSSTGGVIEMKSEEETYLVTIDWLTGKVHYDESS